jgi:hypothetical protein
MSEFSGTIDKISQNKTNPKIYGFCIDGVWMNQFGW